MLECNPPFKFSAYAPDMVVSYHDCFYYYADSQQNKNDLQPEKVEDGAIEPQHTSNSSSTLSHVKERIQSEDMIDGAVAGKCALTFES